MMLCPECESEGECDIACSVGAERDEYLREVDILEGPPKKQPYTSEGIRAEVDKDRARLFAEYSARRLPTWSCDQATRDLICAGKWLSEELVRLGVSDDDRRTQENFYNRWTRGDLDYFGIAALALNTVLEGKVENYHVMTGTREHRGW